MPRMSRPVRGDEPAMRVVTVRLTPTERALIEKAAAVNRQPLAAFVRDAIQEAAADCLDEAIPPVRKT
jgi:uncharacterized protein (DUF1778 family)